MHALGYSDHGRCKTHHELDATVASCVFEELLAQVVAVGVNHQWSSLGKSFIENKITQWLRKEREGKVREWNEMRGEERRGKENDCEVRSGEVEE